ncbi:carbon-monoxide dehydrogenase medium subunit [Saccharopolyspora antimicrobica]|uniref:Carbon-monoxide dehydrogenase medium subunit n=1 Tax=Saccharopolyspora antimicrobica TaxID=455193 RepID=A0A1I5L6I1_9PSEU|nr:FAD binding domain-containing protein [Saccharopolyspora antimicrobica]RKT86894.1 carbon-monoxide dehydrogenase medium subunit [Saccharopolyspora antimicrobica]SFO92351.1 carbon-monoxide dehydrogenase medium subunit [Saccharopolyspora antimicrobica]
MKPPPFDYVRPDSLAEAVRLLAADEDAKALAGGQSLLPMMNFRLARPSVLVDIGRLPELSALRREDDVLVIGAGVRQRTAETAQLVRETCPLLGRALRHIGHHQIRSRGTIGGSLAHADPAAELCAAALALDAEVVVTGSSGRRTIPAAELFVAPYQTSLSEEEILTEVRLPIDGARSGFAEISGRSGDFALAGVAAVVRFEDGEVADARLVGLGVGGTVQRLTDAEAVLNGAALDDRTIDSAAEASGSATPPDDFHADPATRLAALRAAVQRALKQVSNA